MTYRIRFRKRTLASPPAGMSQHWTEYQVVKGRNVISRHDLMEQAQRALDELVAKEKETA